jgi:opacity protein-like surface antigen
MQRTTFILVVVALVSLLPNAATAQSGNSSVQAFGGLTFNTSDFIDSSTATSVGGVVSVGLTPNIQIVGEGGRLSDVSSGLYDLLDFTPVGLDISAWYAQGGVRLIGSPTSVVRPYGEATAGVARLRTHLSGQSGTAGAIADTVLNFLDRTEPVLGVGAGVMFGAGPVAVDVGYRYKHIRTSGLPSVLSLGDAIRINEVRVGVGVRF